MNDRAARKQALRRHFRQLRNAVEPAARRAMGQALRRSLGEAPALREARRLGAYWAFDGEPDLQPLLATRAAAGVGIALPVLDDDGDGRGPCLRWRQWRPEQPMQPNRHGIPEPVATPEWPLRSLDLVLMPLVAWDPAGGRLGMGAGLYDRTLAPLTNLAAANRPLLVGVGFELQRAEQLPRDPWDVPLDAIATENGWLSCSLSDGTIR
jgi:5-formyltetrahydrofolate cyclo-ligase